jgi:hypothetical protein
MPSEPADKQQHVRRQGADCFCAVEGYTGRQQHRNRQHVDGMHLRGNSEKPHCLQLIGAEGWSYKLVQSRVLR